MPLGPLQQTAKISFFAGSDPGSDPAHAVPQMLTSLSVGYVPGLLEMLIFFTNSKVVAIFDGPMRFGAKLTLAKICCPKV